MWLPLTVVVLSKEGKEEGEQEEGEEEEDDEDDDDDKFSPYVSSNKNKESNRSISELSQEFDKRSFESIDSLKMEGVIDE